MLATLLRGQVSSEYMLILGGIIVVVAVVMIGGLKGLELNIALSAARLGAEKFTATRPYMVLGSMDYAISPASTTIMPKFTAYSFPAGDADLAKNYSLRELVAVFAPNATGLPPSGCQKASFRTYCVAPVITNPS